MFKRVGLVLAMVLVLFTSSAMAGLWMGAETGINFPANSTITFKTNNGSTTSNMSFRSSMNGGFLVGYDFINQGLLAFQGPDWMKYFAVSLGLNYVQMNASNQYRAFNTPTGVVNGLVPGIDGSKVNLALMFYAKLPLMVSTDFPYGQLQPYVGVGPMVSFSNFNSNNMAGIGMKSSTDIGVATEAGIRYFVTKAFATDLGFRYSYNPSQYSFITPGVGRTQVNMNNNNMTALFRVSYHF
jgi:opacity protein-like surface antigen